MVRQTNLIVVSVSLAVLTAACQTVEPPTDYGAPPTTREMDILGPDALDDYFLTRYRKCIRWKPEQTCRKEPYGDDDGAFQ